VTVHYYSLLHVGSETPLIITTTDQVLGRMREQQLVFLVFRAMTESHP